MQSLLVPRLANRGIPLLCRASRLARSRHAGIRFLSSKASTRVAVLYQALDPPIINGVRKPKKPGGYQDSGADIAYNLDECDDVQVITPIKTPDPLQDGDWCFTNTEQGILEAIGKGANYLWSNTIVFASHPLQTSTQLDPFQDRVRVIGQGPLVVDKYDDKKSVNDYLRAVRFRRWASRPTSSSSNRRASLPRKRQRTRRPSGPRRICAGRWTMTA